MKFKTSLLSQFMMCALLFLSISTLNGQNLKTTLGQEAQSSLQKLPTASKSQSYSATTQSILSGTRTLLQRTQHLPQLNANEVSDLAEDWESSTKQVEETLSRDKLDDFMCIMGAGGRFRECIEDIPANDPDRDLKRIRCQAQYQVDVANCLLDKEKEPLQPETNPNAPQRK